MGLVDKQLRFRGSPAFLAVGEARGTGIQPDPSPRKHWQRVDRSQQLSTSQRTLVHPRGRICTRARP